MHKQINRRALQIVLAVLLASFQPVWAAPFGGAKSQGSREGEAASLSAADLPPAVGAAFEKEFPGATIGRIEKEEQKGGVVYDLEGQLDGKGVEMDVAADGTVLSREESVPYESVPEAVRGAAEKYFGGAGDYSASREVEQGKVFYEVEGKKAGRTVGLKFSEDGRLLEEERE
jgi:uncharacterized membrane protein YkoI